jgi:hypothetical protein
MPLYGKRYDPDDWDGFVLQVGCGECGERWEHRVKEMDVPPDPGKTITVTTSWVCPKCGAAGSGNVSLTNAGQIGEG